MTVIVCEHAIIVLYEDGGLRQLLWRTSEQAARQERAVPVAGICDATHLHVRTYEPRDDNGRFTVRSYRYKISR